MLSGGPCCDASPMCPITSCPQRSGGQGPSVDDGQSPESWAHVSSPLAQDTGAGSRGGDAADMVTARTVTLTLQRAL